MNRLNKKGINLVELIATLVIMGIAIPVLLLMWANISWRAVGSENVADATFFARALMEEIKSKRFDERTNSPWTSSPSLGVDSGENSANADSFDDADDYINTTDSNIIVPAPGYNRFATVEYVYPDSNSTWQSCPVPVNCVSVSNCTSCNECCYKRITVNLRRADRMPGNLTLTTVLAGN